MSNATKPAYTTAVVETRFAGQAKQIRDLAINLVQSIEEHRKQYGDNEVDCMFEYSDTSEYIDYAIHSLARAIDHIQGIEVKDKKSLTHKVRKATGYIPA